MFFRGFWVWIERHTFVIFSMSSSNNVYKTQHSGDVCRRLQADVGSQGKRTIPACCLRIFPAVYQLHFPYWCGWYTWFVRQLISKTKFENCGKKSSKLSYKNRLSVFMTFQKKLSRKRYTLGQSNKIIENDCLKFSFA